MRRYFWLNGEILQNKYFQYFDRSKTRHDRAKIGLAGQHDRPPLKNYFEPCFLVVCCVVYFWHSSKTFLQMSNFSFLAPIFPSFPLLYAAGEGRKGCSIDENRRWVKQSGNRCQSIKLVTVWTPTSVIRHSLHFSCDRCSSKQSQGTQC